MIINHNLPAMNTYNKLTANNASTSKALEKLSSGLRINRAGDDAAGLAISEKMRGQIRGLDQAKSNSQDGISLIQTAEGNLSETQSILQRMKELATQASNDTNVGVDRGEIQKEINQLTSEINRIGNTTEFNTQKLLKGDGKSNLDSTTVITDGNLAGGLTTNTAAAQTTVFAGLVTGDNGKSMTFTLNGQQLKVNLVENTTTGPAAGDVAISSVTANSVTLTFNGATASATLGAGLKSALNSMILENSVLKNNYTATNATGSITLTAVTGGAFDGKNGSIASVAFSVALATPATSGVANVGTTVYTQATKTINFANYIDAGTLAQNKAKLDALVGTGMTINGQQIEFYNSDDGAYTGSAIGVSISAAKAQTTTATIQSVFTNTIASTVSTKLTGVTVAANVAGATSSITVTDATYNGADGNNKIGIADGGVQKNYQATFQVGANTAQSMSIEISDMRSQALHVSGTTASGSITAKNGSVATLKATMEVTDGTNNTNVEYALDVSDHTKATNAISVLSDAIESVSAERSKLGAYQNRLEHTITNLTTSSENMSAAESRIRDVDMAKEMMNFQKNNILSQAAQAMLAQANQQPQNVLQLLR